MRISETTTHPYPVLCPWSDDIDGTVFAAEVTFREQRKEAQIAIHCAVELDHPDIASLVRVGKATCGCYIFCRDTGLRRIQPFPFPKGAHQFAPGAMLGRVEIRPIVWATTTIPDYAPAGAHPEFNGQVTLKPGDPIALGNAQIIDVTRPPIPSVESIFEIKRSPDLDEGDFEIDLDSNRIIVRMAERTYQLVQNLRHASNASRVAVMNALYVPIVMEVLDRLCAGDGDQLDQYRWLHVFVARCEAVGVDIEKPDFLNDAQKLLERPFASLGCFAGEAE